MSKNDSNPKTFLELYLLGEVLPDEIDDYIDSWHSGTEDQPIYRFLGMSEEEYALWVKHPDSLPQIARARLEGRALAEIVNS